MCKNIRIYIGEIYEKKKIKLKGHLKNYMYWPLMLTILLACMNVPMYFVNEGAALLVSIFLGIYLIVVVISYNVNKPVLVNELINFATQYGTVQKKLLNEFEIPYALFWTITERFSGSMRNLRRLQERPKISINPSPAFSRALPES